MWSRFAIFALAFGVVIYVTDEGTFESTGLYTSAYRIEKTLSSIFPVEDDSPNHNSNAESDLMANSAGGSNSTRGEEHVSSLQGNNKPSNFENKKPVNLEGSVQESDKNHSSKPVDKPAATSNQDTVTSSVESNRNEEKQGTVKPIDKPALTSNEDTVISSTESNSDGEKQGTTKPADDESALTSNQDTIISSTESNSDGEKQEATKATDETSTSENKKPEELSNSNANGDKESKPEEEEEEKEVCFKHLGCFSMEKPWKSILRPICAPMSPEKIDASIFFFSRSNIDEKENITLYPEIKMGNAKFDSSKITVVIVHGFASSGNATWVEDLKDAYLKHVDANVLIVDWGKGSQLLNYLQVAGNTRTVGKQLGNFVKYLKDHHGADPGKFHLIGHSLGAQICSYLAKDVPGIARLTALDPAQPGFEGFDKKVRLDSSDAEFVDVIHTDAKPFLPTLGFGMIAPHGHVDFYMNGGFEQPGCIAPPKEDLPMITSLLDLAKFPVEVLGKIVSCPHGRSYEYLTEAMNETEKCIFWGHKADVKNVLMSVTNTVTQGLLKKFVALSSSCSKEDCTPLGFFTKKSPLRGSFVVTTSAREPFCISEPGIPPEIPSGEKKESVIQKIAKKLNIFG